MPLGKQGQDQRCWQRRYWRACRRKEREQTDDGKNGRKIRCYCEDEKTRRRRRLKKASSLWGQIALGSGLRLLSHNYVVGQYREAIGMRRRRRQQQERQEQQEQQEREEQEQEREEKEEKKEKQSAGLQWLRVCVASGRDDGLVADGGVAGDGVACGYDGRESGWTCTKHAEETPQKRRWEVGVKSIGSGQERSEHVLDYQSSPGLQLSLQDGVGQNNETRHGQANGSESEDDGQGEGSGESVRDRTLVQCTYNTVPSGVELSRRARWRESTLGKRYHGKTL